MRLPNFMPERRWRMHLLVGTRKVLGTLLTLNFATAR